MPGTLQAMRFQKQLIQQLRIYEIGVLGHFTKLNQVQISSRDRKRTTKNALHHIDQYSPI